MIAGRATVALLVRSLREESRGWRGYLMRFGLLGFMLLGLWAAYEESQWRGAPGHLFLSWILYVDFFFITLAGMGYFATAITEEKEEGTLGLLRMTNLNPLSILLGKGVTRMISALILLAAQLPFALLAITMGGVSVHQIIAGYLALLAYTVALAGLGLFWSVIAPRNRGASKGMLLTLALFFFVPPLAPPALVVQGQIPSAAIWPTTVLRACDALVSVSPFTRLQVVLSTGFSDTWIEAQFISNVAAGAALFLVSWLLFNRFNISEADVTPTRWGSGSQRWMAFVRRRGGRAWKSALVWKDFHFIAGGWRGWAFRFVTYALVSGGICYANDGAMNFDSELGEVMVGVGLVGLIAEAAIFAAIWLNEEIRWRTLFGIAMLPRSTGYVLYHKLLGVLMGLVPAALIFVAGVALDHRELYNNLGGIFDEISIYYFIVQIIFFIHLVTLTSLYVKWGAVFITAAIVFMGNSCFFAVTAWLNVFGSDETLLIVPVVILSLATVAVHFQIARQFAARAAE